jgi:hypothetical protein
MKKSQVSEKCTFAAARESPGGAKSFFLPIGEGQRHPLGCPQQVRKTVALRVDPIIDWGSEATGQVPVSCWRL